MGKHQQELEEQARRWNKIYWWHSYPYQGTKQYAARMVSAKMADRTEEENKIRRQKMKDDYGYD